MTNSNNIAAQIAYDHAKKVLYDAWIDSFIGSGKGKGACENWVDGRKLSQSEIRLEVTLNTTGSIFTFGVTPQQAASNSAGGPFNTENRLQLQDSLIVSEYGIFVAQPSSSTDTTFQLRTYPNTQDFAAADVTALQSTFYSNGWFTLKCNNDVLVPYRGLFNHLYRPQTQQTAALGAASPADQIRGGEDGFITQNPNLLLIGSKNYQPQIQLPAALASAAANMRAVIIFKGVLAQNSTVIN